MKTRSETIKLSLRVNKDQFEANKDDILLISRGHAPEVKENDTLEVEMTIGIDYLSGINDRIGAMLRLADNATVSCASFEEIEHGESMLCALAIKFKELKGKFAS